MRSDPPNDASAAESATDPWGFSLWQQEDGRVLLRFPSFVTPKMAAEATLAVVAAARHANGPIGVVADLLDVEGFSPEAAIAAVMALPRGPRLIESIELIVNNKIVRIAAISAAHLAGIPCNVRDHR